jgi:hypothetical protein
MGSFRFQLAMSLDGIVAGPDQSEENPLGVGGLELHQWVFPLEVWRRQQGEEGGEVNASTPVVEEARSNVGATVMGRNMPEAGPAPGPRIALGGAGGARTLPSTRRSLCSPIYELQRASLVSVTGVRPPGAAARGRPARRKHPRSVWDRSEVAADLCLRVLGDGAFQRGCLAEDQDVHLHQP